MTGAPTCPDCGTELTSVKKALWCWKCERYMRLGEDRAARKEAGKPHPNAFVRCGLARYRGGSRS